MRCESRDSWVSNLRFIGAPIPSQKLCPMTVESVERLLHLQAGKRKSLRNTVARALEPGNPEMQRDVLERRHHLQTERGHTLLQAGPMRIRSIRQGVHPNLFRGRDTRREPRWVRQLAYAPNTSQFQSPTDRTPRSFHVPRTRTRTRGTKHLLISRLGVVFRRGRNLFAPKETESVSGGPSGNSAGRTRRCLLPWVNRRASARRCLSPWVCFWWSARLRWSASNPGPDMRVIGRVESHTCLIRVEHRKPRAGSRRAKSPLQSEGRGLLSNRVAEARSARSLPEGRSLALRERERSEGIRSVVEAASGRAERRWRSQIPSKRERRWWAVRDSNPGPLA